MKETQRSRSIVLYDTSLMQVAVFPNGHGLALRRCKPCRAEKTPALTTPSIAETAKTIVSTVNHGTLSTLSEDGTPLGTFVEYVLDKKGKPMLRLQSNALHRNHLEARSRCSLFVQASDLPARRLARVTLIGSISMVDLDEELRSLYLEREKVDGLNDDDQFGQLNIDQVFYVGGLDGNQNGIFFEGSTFIESLSDPLKDVAPVIVREWNIERMEDIYRICKQKSGVPLTEMVYAELSWVDRLGFYISYETIHSKNNVLRIAFPRPVEEDRDARSLLTMMAHWAWESDRNAVPTL